MVYCKKLARVLAYNIKQARQQKGYTQAVVAHKARLSLRQYNKIEGADANPSIQTICSLSTVLDVTPDELMRVKKNKTELSYEQYQEEFKAKFKNAEFGAGIRTLTGVVLWGNKATEDMGLSEKEDGKPVELLKVMKGVSAEILKFQLFCEQVGLITPYTNFITDKVTGDKTFIRYYPTLILPEDGNQPYFVALYITTPESDSQAGYYHFCDKLLSID
jgi:transcriptional regulator with XRE-family HTH domain